ncbi:MAG: hypothetical protein HXX16_07650 [Bacteroidales bacterium]|nr:hypothetical protein [Bacteroidales bacterium]
MNEKGKILRFKTGYNPNSSSIGSHIPTFLALASGLGFMSIVIMNQVKKIDKQIQDKKDDLKSTVTDDE